MKASIFFLGLLGLFAYTSAQSVSVQVDVKAGAATAFNLNGQNGFPLLTSLLPSLSITANDSASIRVVLSVGNLLSGLLSTATTANFAGGLAVNSDGTSTGIDIFADASFASSIASVLGSIANIRAVSLSVVSDKPVQLTIAGTTGSLSASGQANIQVGLFTSYSDNVLGTSGSSSTTVVGAVPYSINADGKTYTYTLNVPAGGSYNGLTGTTTGGANAFFKPFDSSKAKSSNNGGSAAASGSSSFSTAGFIPGVFGYDFALTGGQQYAFGKNIQVTPSASSGSAGTININNVGSFSNSINLGGGASTSGNSAAPAAASNAGVFFNNYYQVSGSGNTNIMQWSSTPSDDSWKNNAFTSVVTNGSVSASTSISGSAAAAAAQAKGTTYSWYKSSTNAGASAAANSWSRVSSTSSADASAGIKVYANVNSYSQWTVASSSGNAVKATIVTMIVALLVIMF